MGADEEGADVGADEKGADLCADEEDADAGAEVGSKGSGSSDETGTDEDDAVGGGKTITRIRNSPLGLKSFSTSIHSVHLASNVCNCITASGGMEKASLSTHNH